MSESSGGRRDDEDWLDGVPRGRSGGMPPSIPPRRASSAPADPRQVPLPPRSATREPATRESGARPGSGRERAQPPRKPAARRRPGRWRRVLRNALLSLLLIALVSAGALWMWVESRIIHVDALSGAANTPGTTFLVVGSDSREGWERDDGITGERTDTIIVVHQPEQGPAALISIPRDSYVEIPGHGKDKINAAFALGGPRLLVQTVEGMTGLTVDRYFEVGLGGVEQVVDAVGGVELCYDRDVQDRRSKLTWEAGCHEVDGKTALAFSRMRYADPTGDIGRTQRQQQLISAVGEKALQPGVLANPFTAIPLAGAVLDSFRVSDGTGALDLLGAARVLNAARGDDAVTGTPPIATIDHRVEGVGSTVLLDPDAAEEFWRRIADGSYEPGTEVGGWG